MPGLHTCHFHASYDGYTLEIFPIAINIRPGGSLSASMSRSSSVTKWSSRGSDAEGAQRLLATVGWTARPVNARSYWWALQDSNLGPGEET